MDVEEAFTQEAIARYDTNVDGEVEDDLRNIITQIYTTNEIAGPTDDQLNINMLCFVAGRTYQADLPAGPILIDIPMTPDEVHEYIAYLAQKGS
jgi:hypothetical protein